jgi:hypothetical protein
MISSLIEYFSYILGTVLVLSIFGMIFASKTLILTFVIILISIVAIAIVLCFITNILCAVFAFARFKYRKAIAETDFFFKKNYDKIDEQHIDGINKFKYIKIDL